MEQFDATTAVAVQDYTNTGSYIHYARPFGMVDKSPLSRAMCPELHLFIHMVGLYIGMGRSENARYPPVVNITATSLNAKYMAFAMLKPKVDVPGYINMANGFRVIEST